MKSMKIYGNQWNQLNRWNQWHQWNIDETDDDQCKLMETCWVDEINEINEIDERLVKSMEIYEKQLNSISFGTETMYASVVLLLPSFLASSNFC